MAQEDYLKIPVQRIEDIITGKQGITSDIAWLLSQAFNTTPQFWMNLQTNYDLAINTPKDIKTAISIS